MLYLLQVASRKSQVASLILTALLSVSMFTSCKDELKEINTQNSHNANIGGRDEKIAKPINVSVENGRLKFNSFYEFSEFQSKMFFENKTK